MNLEISVRCRNKHSRNRRQRNVKKKKKASTTSFYWHYLSLRSALRGRQYVSLYTKNIALFMSMLSCTGLGAKTSDCSRSYLSNSTKQTYIVVINFERHATTKIAFLCWACAHRFSLCRCHCISARTLCSNDRRFTLCKVFSAIFLPLAADSLPRCSLRVPNKGKS